MEDHKIKYELRMGELFLECPKLIVFRFKQVDPYPTFEEYQELIELELKLANNENFAILADMRNIFGTMDNKSKEMIANHSELNRLKSFQAYLVNSLPIKLMLKGYLAFYKPEMYYKIFTSEEDAMLWLKQKVAEL